MKPKDFDAYSLFYRLTEKIMFIEAKVQLAYDNLSSLSDVYQLLQKNNER